MEHRRTLLLMIVLMSVILLSGFYFLTSSVHTAATILASNDIPKPAVVHNINSEATKVYSKLDGLPMTHLDLDSQLWNNISDSFISQIQNTLDSPDVYVKCHDSVRNRTFVQQLTSLPHGRHVVGRIPNNTRRSVCFSVGAIPNAKEKQLSYLFYTPLTSLSLKRIDMNSIIIVADSLENWLFDEMFRHVLKYICHTEALVIFIPTPPPRRRQVSQSSRLFVALLLKEVSQIRGISFEDISTINLMTSDSDLWTLKKDFFPQSKSSKIISLNSGCCHMYDHRGMKRKMYPMSYLTTTVATWLHLLTNFTEFKLDTSVTYDKIVDLQIKEFGITMTNATTLSNWFMDQYFLSDWLAFFIQQHGKDSVLFGNRPGSRIDRPRWPAALSKARFDESFDAHVIHYTRNENTWNRLKPLINFMYGTNSLDTKWCSTYREQFNRITFT